jgi:hypothetical protein
MTVYFPDGVDAQGNESVVWVPVLADPTAPTIAELNAATSINISCSIRAFSPNAEQSTSEDIRHCSRETFENPGRVKWTIDDVEFIDDPQADPTGDYLHKSIERGDLGHIVRRRGFDAQTEPYAVGQKVTVFPVIAGQQIDQPVDASAEGSKFTYKQKFFISGPVVAGEIVAAA